jgi:hypothetical protein
VHALGNDVGICDDVIMYIIRFLFYDSKKEDEFKPVLQQKIYRMLFSEILRCSVGNISRSDDDFEDPEWVVNNEIINTGEPHLMAASNCTTCGNYYHYKSYDANAVLNLFCVCL